MRLYSIKLSSCSAIMVLAYIAIAAPVENSLARIEGRDAFSIALIEPNQIELVSRSNIPILDQILSALKDSGIANIVIEFVLLDSTLRQISTNVTISLLKSNKVDMTNLLIGLEKSGLIILFLNLALDDPEITVGLLRITKELLKQFGLNLKRGYATTTAPPTIAPAPTKDPATTPATAPAPSFASATTICTSAIAPAPVYAQAPAVAPSPATAANPIPASESAPAQETDLLTEILTSLNDSGLAMSVIQSLLTNPDLAEPSAIFLADIIKSGAIPVGDILVAVKQSNIVYLLLRDILTNRELLSKFGNLIKGRIANGSISQELYDSI